MTINRKRLAITAAPIGAVVYPTLAGGWEKHLLPYGDMCMDLAHYHYYSNDPMPYVACGYPVLLFELVSGAVIAASLPYLGPLLLARGITLWRRWKRWVSTDG